MEPYASSDIGLYEIERRRKEVERIVGINGVVRSDTQTNNTIIVDGLLFEKTKYAEIMRTAFKRDKRVRFILEVEP